MLLKSNNNVHKIPNIPQIGDYRYAKDLCCGCSQPNSFENWECDGVYDSSVGILVCFTCKKCGEKFATIFGMPMTCMPNMVFFDKFKV